MPGALRPHCCLCRRGNGRVSLLCSSIGAARSATKGQRRSKGFESTHHVSSAWLPACFPDLAWQTRHPHTRAPQSGCQFGSHPEPPVPTSSQSQATRSPLSGSPGPPHPANPVGEFQTPAPVFVEAQGTIFRVFSHPAVIITSILTHTIKKKLLKHANGNYEIQVLLFIFQILHLWIFRSLGYHRKASVMDFFEV